MCTLLDRALVIEPVESVPNGEFDDLILADLIKEGYEGDALLAEFKQDGLEFVRLWKCCCSRQKMRLRESGNMQRTRKFLGNAQIKSSSSLRRKAVRFSP